MLLTTSCTHALEMAALRLDCRNGDEIIVASFTFVSTANAFVLRGARLVFADIRPETLNLDETRLESLLTSPEGTKVERCFTHSRRKGSAFRTRLYVRVLFTNQPR